MRIVYKTGIVMVAVLGLFSLAGSTVLAAENGGHAASHWGYTFLLFAITLVAGKIGNAVEKLGQPDVIGELLAGVVLVYIAYLNLGRISTVMDDIRDDTTIAFLASFGAVLLLFSIGLESNLAQMKSVGLNALMVAIIGVIVPFSLGVWVLGPLFYGQESVNAHLFLGAGMVATSVGITASVFRSVGIIRTRAAQTVLGAAVFDDVLGLMILALVSALASGGEADARMVAELVLKSFGFLAGAIILGTLTSGWISRFFSFISAGVGMKLGVALAFALVFGYLAEVFGLEPIIGAFAAGLILDHVHFNRYADPSLVHDLKGLQYEEGVDRLKVDRIIAKHRHGHVEDLIGNLNLVFVPIFFVYTGLQIDIESLLQPKLYLIAGVISAAAIAGKVVAGIAAKGDVREKLLVGISMVPRGEVGLIFAATGQQLGVLSQELFSVIVLVVIITTFVSPPLIGRLGARLNS